MALYRSHKWGRERDRLDLLSSISSDERFLCLSARHRLDRSGRETLPTDYRQIPQLIHPEILVVATHFRTDRRDLFLEHAPMTLKSCPTTFSQNRRSFL